MQRGFYTLQHEQACTRARRPGGQVQECRANHRVQGMRRPEKGSPGAKAVAEHPRGGWLKPQTEGQWAGKPLQSRRTGNCSAMQSRHRPGPRWLCRWQGRGRLLPLPGFGTDIRDRGGRRYGAGPMARYPLPDGWTRSAPGCPHRDRSLLIIVDAERLNQPEDIPVVRRSSGADCPREMSVNTPRTDSAAGGRGSRCRPVRSARQGARDACARYAWRCRAQGPARDRAAWW